MEESDIRLELVVAAVAMIRDRLQIVVVDSGTDSLTSLLRGSISSDHDVTKSARKVLQEKTRIEVSLPRIRQIGAFFKPANRASDQGAVLSVAYLAIVDSADAELAELDFKTQRFVPLEDFERSRSTDRLETDIAQNARRILRHLVETSPIALRFCPSRFTLKQLRRVYEEILGHDVDPANFRRKVLAAEDFIESSSRRKTRVGSVGRPSDYFKRGLADELEPPIRFRPLQ